MLDRSDFAKARQIELGLLSAGQPGRVVTKTPFVWGLVLSRVPERPVLAVLSAAIAAVLGPVHLMRRGRLVVVQQ